MTDAAETLLAYADIWKDRALKDGAQLDKLTTPRPASEYHEDMGDVLWWKFPIEEAPYCGSPNDLGFRIEAHTTTRIITQLNQEHDPGRVVHRINAGGWPGYHTHWTPIPIPKEP